MRNTIKCEFCKGEFEWLNDCKSIFGHEYELCDPCLRRTPSTVYAIGFSTPRHNKQDSKFTTDDLPI